MPSKRDLLLLNGLALGVILLILLGGCGILTGNPETTELSAAPEGYAFLDPTAEYLSARNAKAPEQTDCGYFTGQSPEAAVAAGQDCVRKALTDCREAFYLFDQTKVDNARFAAFVIVLPDCQVKVHAVSTDATRFVGDQTKTCSELSEPIEMSCNIGS
jgi:hypothetical protein